MEMGGVNRSFKMFWANLQYISISAVPILWLTFALQYSGRTQWVQAKYLVPLSIVPLTSVVIAQILSDRPTD
jgi:hypothetical protein